MLVPPTTKENSTTVDKDQGLPFRENHLGAQCPTSQGNNAAEGVELKGGRAQCSQSGPGLGTKQTLMATPRGRDRSCNPGLHRGGEATREEDKLPPGHTDSGAPAALARPSRCRGLVRPGQGRAGHPMSVTDSGAKCLAPKPGSQAWLRHPVAMWPSGSQDWRNSSRVGAEPSPRMGRAGKEQASPARPREAWISAQLQTEGPEAGVADQLAGALPVHLIFSPKQCCPHFTDGTQTWKDGGAGMLGAEQEGLGLQQQSPSTP